MKALKDPSLAQLEARSIQDCGYVSGKAKTDRLEVGTGEADRASTGEGVLVC